MGYGKRPCSMCGQQVTNNALGRAAHERSCRKQQIANELKRRVVDQGKTEEEKRKKAEWFKTHVIIDMGD
jgi:ribosomal protein S21